MQNEFPISQDDNQQPFSTGAPVSTQHHSSSHSPLKSGKTSKVVLLSVVAAVVVFAAGAFFGYRQYQANSANHADTSPTGQLEEESDADAANLDQAALADEPEASAAPDTSTSTTTNSGNSSSGATTQASQPRKVNFTKGGSNVFDGVVSASANLSANETGTCTFKFSLNGTVRVLRTSQISNSKVCSIEIPVSEFPKSATYKFELSFQSTDGLATATQDTYDIVVN